VGQEVRDQKGKNRAKIDKKTNKERLIRRVKKAEKEG
jgi:hypothetical protein